MSDAKDYISKKQIPQLFECLMTGLMYHRPSDHIAYLQQCLDKIKVQGVSGVRWDLFLEAKRTKTPLPPVTPPRSGKHSSRTSSVSELVDKKPILPPIGAAAAAATATTDRKDDKDSDTFDAPAGATTAPPPPVPKLRKPLTCPVVLVMGGPGSAKREICSHLAKRYGFASLCAGDLVRARVRDSRDSRQLWAVAAAAFERGDAVPEELLLPALVGAINDIGSCNGIFIEGYPRSLAQADAFVEHIKWPDRALLLDFEEDLLQERLLRRYHSLGAVEDQPANIGRRIGHFKANGLPACRLYDEEKKLVVIPVDEDLDDAAIFAEAARAMDAFFTAVDTSAGPKQQQPKVTDLSRPDSAASGASSKSAASVAAAVAASGAVTHIQELTGLPEPVAKRPADLPQCPLVLVMGGPGSGRSSQIRRLAERYSGFVHVNATEEARNRSLAAGPDAAWGALLDIAVQGDLDEEVPVEELRRLLAEKGKGANCILLEGYPINESQLRDFYQQVGAPDLIVLLDCEEVYMVRRLLARGKSNAGGIGDSLSAVSKRVAYFKERTLPVVRHFDLAGKLCIVLGDRDDSEVFYDLAGLFDYVFFNQKPQHVQQEEQRAAETIQAAFDAFLAREAFASASEPAPAEEEAAEADDASKSPSSEEQEAATKIQATFRGYQTRKNLSKQA